MPDCSFVSAGALWSCAVGWGNTKNKYRSVSRPVENASLLRLLILSHCTICFHERWCVCWWRCYDASPAAGEMWPQTSPPRLFAQCAAAGCGVSENIITTLVSWRCLARAGGGKSPWLYSEIGLGQISYNNKASSTRQKLSAPDNVNYWLVINSFVRFRLWCWTTNRYYYWRFTFFIPTNTMMDGR